MAPMAEASNIGFDGHVPRTFKAGYVLLSYLVSVAGCATCLELLHRRTARFGQYNWILLVASAISMGGIGIWCMHFIGDSAISLHGDTYTSDISYNSGFTTLSFFLPIVMLALAFYCVGDRKNPAAWHICLAGTLIGAAVCGMHYIGELGITNYEYSHSPFHVVGAAIIAVFASILALATFFRFRQSWSSRWWKRSLSATLLASAVSGMHWTAAAGTSYHRVLTDVDTSSRLTAAQTVIACSVLASVACVFLISVAVLANRQMKRSANRVHQLVLACAYFDSSGAIMVSPDGLLPNCKITSHYVSRKFADDELSKTHAAFIWAFRASRNWETLVGLIPGMRHHLVQDPLTRPYCPGESEKSRNDDDDDDDAESDIDFELVFKEQFCVAAQDLATQIDQRLDRMGVLFDDIMVTGTRRRRSNLSKSRKASDSDDSEAGRTQPVIGKGQCLFIVRHLDTQEVMNFSARGHRFAAISHITHNLARAMQVPHSGMSQTLERMKHHSFLRAMMEPGVHLVCFSLTPRLYGGFDVLVRKDAPNILPHIHLPISSQVSQWQQEILNRMDGLTLTACIKWLKEHSEGYTDPEEVNFIQQLYEAASKLERYLVDTDLRQAIFSCHPIKIPCKQGSHMTEPTQCTAFSFRIINGLQARAMSPQLELSPLNLFNAQQQVYPGVPDHEDFCRDVLDEFAHCVQYSSGEDSGSACQSLKKGYSPATSTRHRSFTPSFRNSLLSFRNSLVKSEPEDVPKQQSTKSHPMFGGIIVTNDITVDVEDRADLSALSEHGNAPKAFESDHCNTTSVEAGNTRGSHTTFVDELMVLCRHEAEDMRR